MVHITPTLNETVSHLFCDVDWWGDEVPNDQALDIALAHEASDAHIEAEIAQAAFEDAARCPWRNEATSQGRAAPSSQGGSSACHPSA